MDEAEYRLMNFKIDLGIKSQFQNLCRSRRSNMTTELNRMIYEFLGTNKKTNTLTDPVDYLNDTGTTKA